MDVASAQQGLAWLLASRHPSPYASHPTPTHPPISAPTTHSLTPSALAHTTTCSRPQPPAQMETLHLNIQEALRMNPPLVMLMRYAKESFTVNTSDGKQYVVPKVSARSTARAALGGLEGALEGRAWCCGKWWSGARRVHAGPGASSVVPWASTPLSLWQLRPGD